MRANALLRKSARCRSRLHVASALRGGGLAVAAALLAAAGRCGTIAWEAPQTIGADTDVSTAGASVYAYHCNLSTNQASFSLNGVRFMRWSRNGGGAFCRDADLIDGGPQKEDDWSAGLVAVEGTFSADYVAALRHAACGGLGREMRLRLKSLVPGRRYAVQLWFNSTGCADMRDRTETVDGAVVLRGSVGADGPGQHVCGTFTATDTFQDVVLKPEDGSYPAFNMFQVRALDAVAVRWSSPADIAGADDVRTDGRLVFAYANSGTERTVNGTTFASVAQNVTAYPKMENDGGRFAHLVMGADCSWFDGFLASGEAPSDYLAMLKGGVYRDGEASSLTLRGLVPGHSYLVQVWVNDSRDAGTTQGWAYRTVRVGGSAPLRYGGMGEAGCGQFVTGTFVADTETLTLALEPGLSRDDVNCKPCAQWNAIQLRDVTPGAVAWSAPRAVTGDPDADVDAEGAPLYAWHNGTNEVVYGGVAFRARCRRTGGENFATVAAAAEDVEIHDMASRADGMIPNVTAANGWARADALQDLLGGCCYGDLHRSAGVTLRRLVPGRRYRVQIFWADTRPKMGRQDFCLDGQVRVPLCDATEGAGWSATGAFTATGTERDILITTFGTRESIHFQALQVRALDASGLNARLDSGEIVSAKDETDVDTEGTLVEACAAEALTVNGVPFTVPGSTTWASEHFAFPEGFTFNAAVTRTYLPNPSTDYERLVGGGFYRDGYNPATLTVRNLRPGRRYRLQLWQCDARADKADRGSEVGDYGGRTYCGENGLGWYARIDFVAAGATWPLEIRSASFQINAVQLRDLGDGELPVWSGVHALAEDAAPDGNVFVRGGAVTVTGPGALAMSGEFVGGDARVEAPWTGTVLCRTGAGRTVLAASPETPQTLVAAGEGVIQIAEGVTVAAALLGGDGTLAGPGAVDYAPAGDAAFAGRLAEGVVVRKGGSGTWRLSGAQTGVASVAVTEGALRLGGGTFAGDLSLASERPVAVCGTAFADGATLRLAGETGLRTEGAADLDGLTVRVESPRSHLRRTGRPILVYAQGEAKGRARIAFAEKGFAVEEVEEGALCAVYAAFTGGLTILVR